MADAGAPPREAPAAVLIVALAAALRLAGIGWGLPHLYHQDESILVNHALAMGVTGWNTGFFVIPPFIPTALFLLYACFYAAGTLAGLFHSRADFAFAFVSDPSPFYLLGRIFCGALFGTAAVALVWRTGRRFVSPRAGLFAALFLAVFPMHVQHGHYVYADVPVAFASALFLHRLLALARKPSLRRYVLMGAVFGWAVSVKYTAFYFVPAAAVAHAIACGGLRGALLRWKRAAAAAGASLAVFAAVSPFTFLDWPAFWGSIVRQSGAEGSPGPWHHLIYSLGEGAGFPALALAAAGIAVCASRRPAAFAVLGAGCAAYYAVNVFFSQDFARYMMPLLPAVALFAGAGWEWLSARLGDFSRGILLCGAVLSALAPSVYADWLFLRDDTRTECLRWFEKNVPEGAVVVRGNRFFSPPLAQSAAQIAAKAEHAGAGSKAGARKARLELELKAAERRKTYEVYTLKPAGEPEPDFLSVRPWVEADWESLDSIGTQYLVLDRADAPAARALAAPEAGRVEPVAVFSPYREGVEPAPADPKDSTAAPHRASELFKRKRLGPVLEVYRVKR